MQIRKKTTIGLLYRASQHRPIVGNTRPMGTNLTNTKPSIKVNNISNIKGNAMKTAEKTVELKSTKRELYDAEEYKNKMQTMIEKLRSKRPGSVSGMVGKNEVLTMYKKEIQNLVDDGYTIRQITEAMKADVFGILPKSITQVLTAKAKKKTAKAVAVAKPKAATVKDKSTEPSATFLIKQDEQL